MNDTVTVAVIGNASAGKTSFLRSFTRDLTFGEVGVGPTTNSKKETGNNNIVFVDTPGFQNSEQVRQWVFERIEIGEPPSPQKIIKTILERLEYLDRTDEKSQSIMKHDKIAWEAIKDADAILYLVDIRQDPELDDNLESSYKLLPNGVHIIFNFLPQDNTELEKCHDSWNNLREKWGKKGKLINYDAFHRDYDSEMLILKEIQKLVDSSKDYLMERYIQRRIEEERVRLFKSFEMLISLIDHLSKLAFSRDNIPKEATDEENVNVLYNKFEPDLSNAIELKIKAFCNAILYIWGFRTINSDDINNNSIIPGLLKDDDSDMFAMSKLVRINTSVISHILSCHEIKKRVRWNTHFTSLFPWKTDKKICGRISLNHSPLLKSFIPCALDFIKKVRERGLATPSSLYPNQKDDLCNNENRIAFIMPTEPETANIDSCFNEFNWTKKDAATKDWIPKLFKIFGMTQDR